MPSYDSVDPRTYQFILSKHVTVTGKIKQAVVRKLFKVQIKKIEIAKILGNKIYLKSLFL